MIQFKSSSPSSSPPGPPCTARNNLGRQSTPSSARFAASSRCMFSIRDFSSVAALWSLFLMAMLTFSHSLTDSRSSCSATGLVFGYVSFAFDASKRRSLLPVCVRVSNCRLRPQCSTYCQILDKHLSVPVTGYLKQVLVRFRVLDESLDCIVCASKIPLGLELDICHKSRFGRSQKCMVTKLVFHLSEQDASSVHVWLRDEAGNTVSACLQQARWLTYYLSL